jgi:hypothetical protein
MDGTRPRLRSATALVAVAVTGALAILLHPSPARAQDEPPDVRGLPVTEATSQLAQWNRSVFFIYEPPPDIGLDIDPANVVVSRMELVAAPGSSANRPVVRLITGRRIPDVAGLTREQALTAIQRRELVLVTSPQQAPANWVIRSQQPEAGTILEFTPANAVTVVLADPAVPVVEDRRWLGLSRPALVAVAGSSVAVLAVLALLTTLAVRRAGRRRAPSAPDQSEPEPAVTVRLVPHYDPGTLTLHQDGSR